MSPSAIVPDFAQSGALAGSLDDRLEQGEVVFFPRCPFPLPEGQDREFLLAQRLGGGHKNISYNPHNERAGGFRRMSPVQAERLRRLLASFSQTSTEWLAGALPRYAASWQLDRVSYRPEEEATRRLRLTARNDLLHVDSFPSRPTGGKRILRLFANINPVDSRVWVTSDSFGTLLDRFGYQVGLPNRQGWGWNWRQVLRIFRPDQPRQSIYDAFMLRFHDFLKTNEEFQERCSKHYWTFPPESAWLVFTDQVSHAALRGRFALEHSYFVAPDALLRPEQAPAALLERACGRPVLEQAA
jgi:3-deoxy-D-manno-oct-2-ulosonic acid (Kdo) hydroxylase